MQKYNLKLKIFLTFNFIFAFFVFNFALLVGTASAVGIIVTPKVDYTTGAQPYSVAIGNLNNDSNADMAVVNSSSNTVSVFLNNGSGTFATKVDYTTGTTPYSVAIGDLDGDGDADMAVGNYNSATVSVFLNNGSGTFASKVDYSTGPGAKSHSVVIGDLDGDGDKDMAVANYSYAAVSVFKNNGNGTFASKVDYSTGADFTYSIAIGDLDGDGDVDMTTANGGNNNISVFKNNGNGTFANSVNYPTGYSWTNSVAISDLNGDGKAEIAAVARNSGGLVVFINNGSGAFPTKDVYITGVSPMSVAIGDLNGDSNPDMATTNRDSTTVSVFLNNGNGTFATKADYTVGAWPYSVAIGDLNGDSNPDMTVANYLSDTVSVLMVTPDVAIPPPGAPGAPSVTAGNGQVAITGWTTPTTGGTPSGYRLYSSADNFTTKIGADIPASPTFPIFVGSPTIVNGTSYTFKVSAYGSAGAEGVKSSASSPAVTPQYPPLPLGAPSPTAGDTQVALSWSVSSPVSDSTHGPATGYFIYRKVSTDPDTSYTKFNTTPITGTSGTVTGLTNNNSYVFKITANNIGGESLLADSTASTPVTPIAPVYIPNAPGTPSRALEGSGGVRLTWTAPTVDASHSEATGYYMYYKKTSDSIYTKFNTLISSPTLTGVVTGLVNNTTYTFTVSGVNSTGEGDPSLPSSSITIPSPPPPEAVSSITFTPPAFFPPYGNTQGPIGVGVETSIKSGGLVLGAGGPQVGLNVLGGNVGIGIGASAPATKLEVGGTGITATDFCLKDGSWCASTQGGAGGGGVSGGTANYITRWAGASTLDLSLIYDNGTNIGIGTTNPTGLLHLNDNGATPTARPMLNITRPNSQGIPGQDSSNAGLYILTRDYPLNVDVYDTGAVGGYRPAFTIDGNGDTTIRGNVLVDNPDPAGTLFDVEGTVKANNIFLGIGGWSIFDPTGLGQTLKIGSGGGATGGLDIFNLNVSNPTGTATFAKDITAGGNITATSFCFSGGGNCLTPANTGVSSVTSTNNYIDVAPLAGTGDVQLTLGITPLVNYLDDIFQLQANNPDPANPNSYVCPVGEALVEIDALGGFICEPIGGGGSVGPGTVGSLPKFVTANQVGDSGVFEDEDGNVAIGIGDYYVDPLIDTTTKLDVQSPAGVIGILGYANTGVVGQSNSPSGTGVQGSDSGIGTGGYGVTGLSTNANGTGVYGQASNTGGTGGLFRFTGTPGQGHALKTTNGPVYLDQTVGIGYDPLSVSWPSVTPPNSTSQPMKLRVGGPVGARLYCDEDGTGCIEIGPTSLLYCSGDGTNCVDLSNATTNYWTLVPGTEAIYNNNRGANGTVGIGVDPLNLSSFEKFNVLTNDGENIAIKGETSTNGGIGIYGSAGAGSTNAYGVVGKANGTGGAGGYFSYNGVGNGYSLVADFGLVQLGREVDNGIVGVGTAPANWVTSGGRKSIQMKVRGNVGAAYYCDEDGYDCATVGEMKSSHWLQNPVTKDIYNVNPSLRVGIGTAVPRGALDVQGAVYADKLCMKTSTTNSSEQCAPTWEDIARIFFD